MIAFTCNSLFSICISLNALPTYIISGTQGDKRGHTYCGVIVARQIRLRYLGSGHNQASYIVTGKATMYA